MPPATPQPPPGRSPAELRRKAHARLAERMDPARSRHRPLSLLRLEAKRILDQFLDAEAAPLSKPERDRLVEDVLAGSPAVGPLEELFRDETVKEVLVLGTGQVIVRKGDAWLPSSARFRDAEQVRGVLARYAEVAEPVVAGPPAVGGLDVRLANGWRVVAVVPPEVLEDQAPLVLFVRAAAAEAPAARTGSGVRPVAPERPGLVAAPAPQPPGSGVRPGIPPTPPAAVPAPPRPAADAYDPLARVRQRLSERIVLRLASAGVSDLNQVPLADLRQFVFVAVQEFCQEERLAYDDATQQRLAREILASMNR